MYYWKHSFTIIRVYCDSGHMEGIMKMRYKGRTGIYEGKLFIKDHIYKVDFIGNDPYRKWKWYKIGRAEIPYTDQGFKDIWKPI